jgi:hypothetical protein
MKRFAIHIALVLALCLVFGVLLGNATSGTASAATLKTTTRAVTQFNQTPCGPNLGHGFLQFFFNTDVMCFANAGYIAANPGTQGIFTGVYVICSGDNQVVVTENQSPYGIGFTKWQCKEIDPHAWITVIRIL